MRITQMVVDTYDGLTVEQLASHAAYVFACSIEELGRHGELKPEDVQRILDNYVPLYGPKTLWGRAWQRLFSPLTANSSFMFKLGKI